MKYVKLIIIVAASLMYIILIVKAKEKQLLKRHYDSLFVEKLDDYRYWLTPVGKVKFRTTVCDDYPAPTWATGNTLCDITFVDNKWCWSLDPNIHAGYYYERGPDGRRTFRTEPTSKPECPATNTATE